MQIKNFTQLWSGFKQEVHNFPNRHISSISLLILTCNISLQNDLKGQVLWYDHLDDQTHTLKMVRL